MYSRGIARCAIPTRRILFRCAFALMIILPIFSANWQSAAALLVNDGTGGFYVEQSAVSQTSPSPVGQTCTNCGSSFGYEDTAIAIGNGYVLEATKKGISIYLESTRALWGAGTYGYSAMFGTPSGQYCGDQQILYDSQSQRWFGEVLEWEDPSTSCGTTTANIHVDIAVSVGRDPTVMPWTLHQIMNTSGPFNSFGGTFPDHPEIAVSSDKLTITASWNDKYWVISKNDLIQNLNPYHYATPGLPTGILQNQGCGQQIVPVRAINPSTTQYMVCDYSNPFTNKNDIYLFSVDGLPPSVTTSTLVSSAPIASLTAPPNGTVSAPTSSGTIVYARGNLLFGENAYSLNGNLWFAGPSGCVPAPGDAQRSCIHLTEYLVGNKVVQDFDWGIKGSDVYLPALSFDGLGDVGLIFVYSSPSIWPSLGVAGQTPNDPSGSLTPYVTVVTGNYYTRLDYIGASPDPSNSTLIWAAGGYWPSSGSAATFISAMQVIGLEMAPGPSTLKVYPGYSVSTVVTVYAFGALSGKVSLSASFVPSTWLNQLSVSVPSSIQVPLGGYNTATAVVDATHTQWGGSLNLTVTATVLGLSVTLPVPVNVPYYNMNMCCGTGFNFPLGSASSGWATLTMTSQLNFAGNVNMSATVPQGVGISASFSPVTVAVPGGGAASSTITIADTASTPCGIYQVTAIATYNSYFAYVNIRVQVGSSCYPIGSVMAGTSITMADGTQLPVQNIQVGMMTLAYDPSTAGFYNATVTSVVTKSLSSMYVITTDSGNPIRVDYWEQFWTKLPSGQTLWTVAGNIQPGYKIFMPSTHTWATVTSISLSTGNFTVYDLIINPALTNGMNPLIANGYLDGKTH